MGAASYRAPAEPAAGSGPAIPRWDPRARPPPLRTQRACATRRAPYRPSPHSATHRPLLPARRHFARPRPVAILFPRAPLPPPRPLLRHGPARPAPPCPPCPQRAPISGSRAAAQASRGTGPPPLGYGSARRGPPGPVRSRPPRATALTDARAVRDPQNTSKPQRNVRRAWRGGAL